MDFAGGIRRPIVEDKQRLAFARVENALLNISSMPGLELPGLVLRQIGLHGEIGLGQVESFLQIEWFGHRRER